MKYIKLLTFLLFLLVIGIIILILLKKKHSNIENFNNELQVVIIPEKENSDQEFVERDDFFSVCNLKCTTGQRKDSTGKGPYCIRNISGENPCVDTMENGTCDYNIFWKKCPPKPKNTLELRKYIYDNILTYYKTTDITKRNEAKKNVENVNTIEITDMSGLFSYLYETDDGKYPFNEATESLNFTATQKADLIVILQTEFNMDISKWNTSNVTNMKEMFKNAYKFNKNISTKIVKYTDSSSNEQQYTAWDTSNVTNMKEMFKNVQFNQNIRNWNVSSDVNVTEMFNGAQIMLHEYKDIISTNGTPKLEFFNEKLSIKKLNSDKPTPIPKDPNNKIHELIKGYFTNENEKANIISEYGPISTWDTSQVTKMFNLFSIFNLEVELIEKVTGEDNINIEDSQNINTKIINANNGSYIAWDTSSTTDMEQMFTGAINFDGDISNWDVSNVTNMNLMFNGATKSLNKYEDLELISDDGTPTKEFFNFSTNRPSPIPNIILPRDYKGDVINESTKKIDEISFSELVKRYFNGTPDQKDKIIKKYGYITTWDTSKVTDMSNAFKDLTTYTGEDNTEYQKSQNINTKIVKYTDNGIEKEYIAWNTSEVTNMNSMFRGATNFNGNVSNWDTSQVKNMSYMFGYVIRFNGDISKWDTSQVTNMNSMFVYAKAFNKNINTTKIKKNLEGTEITYNAWDTSNVTNMNSMFRNAEKFNGNISNWDTSNVTDMIEMFEFALVFDPLGDKNINTKVVENVRIDEEGKDVPYTAWDTSQVNSMLLMFFTAIKFNGNISNWDTSQVKNMRQMFNGASVFNQDISKKNKFDSDRIKENGDTEYYIAWDTQNVDDLQYMFRNALSFNQNIRNWNVSSDVNVTEMFQGANQEEFLNNYGSLIENGTPKRSNPDFFNYQYTPTTTSTMKPTTTSTMKPTTTSTMKPTTNSVMKSTTTSTINPVLTNQTTTSVTTSVTTSTTIPGPTTTTILPVCRFIPNGETERGCIAECLSPRNKNFGGDVCDKDTCEAKCSECKNSNLCKWLIQSEYNKDKIKLEGIEGNKRVQLYWTIDNDFETYMKEFIVYYKNTYTDNINAGVSIKTIPFKQNKKNYSIVIDNLDNSTDYSFVVNLVNNTNNIEYISNTINLIPNSITQLIL